jgi:hypothetical protein
MGRLISLKYSLLRVHLILSIVIYSNLAGDKSVFYSQKYNIGKKTIAHLLNCPPKKTFYIKKMQFIIRKKA